MSTALTTADSNEVVTAGSPSNIAPHNNDCQTLTVSNDSSDNADQINGNSIEKSRNFRSESDLNLLKDVICPVDSPTTNTLLVPTQILIRTEDIDSLAQTVNFDDSSDLLDQLSTKETPSSQFATKQVVNSDEVELNLNITTETLVDQITEANTISNITINTSTLPLWATKLKDCELIGNSYRGYVNTEDELDTLLVMHKEETNSCWGTRQSPSSAKPSVRLMWKSQYVPYDGVPFLNSGRRAIVMECQYGPRRKGNKVKVQLNETGEVVKKAHKPTCPARIYIKKVKKFPAYKVDPGCEKMAGTRQAQEKALAALRQTGFEKGGEERFYVQFPLEMAHQYHKEDDEVLSQPNDLSTNTDLQVNTSSRLDYRVTEKINELVARGVTGLYEVKHGVIQFVEKELFSSNAPPRHNKTYFPTITDIQNHIHQAKRALETGTLASLPPPEKPLIVPRKCERNSKRKRSEPRRVRTPKTTFDPVTSCSIPLCTVQTDQIPVGSNNTDTSQVYVMVPAASSLFSPSDPVLTTSPLNSDSKTSSLVQMQVVTVPVTGQKGECSISLAGQYLSLPLSALPVENVKDIPTADIQNIEIPHAVSTSNESSSAPLPSNAITMYSTDVTMCESSVNPIITTANNLPSFTKNNHTVLSTIDKNTAVNELFVSESKPGFITNTTDMYSIPCFTEESYNSSLNIIKANSESIPEEAK